MFFLMSHHLQSSAQKRHRKRVSHKQSKEHFQSLLAMQFFKDTDLSDSEDKLDREPSQEISFCYLIRKNKWGPGTNCSTRACDFSDGTWSGSPRFAESQRIEVTPLAPPTTNFRRPCM